MGLIKRWGMKTKMLVSLSCLIVVALTSIMGFNMVYFRGSMQSIIEDVTILGKNVQSQQKSKLTEVENELAAADKIALTTKGRSLAEFVAGLAPTPLLTFDIGKLDEFCAFVCKDPDIILCHIKGNDGEIRSTFANGEDATLKSIVGQEPVDVNQAAKILAKSEGIIFVQAPIVQDNQDLGAIAVYLLNSNEKNRGERFSAFYSKTGQLFSGLIDDICTKVDRHVKRALISGVVATVCAVVVFVIVILFSMPFP